MIARIAGVVLPNKRLEVALGYIYGIGRTRANEILADANVDRNRRPSDLNEGEINTLRELIERRYKVEGELRREILGHIKRFREIGSYKGMRHAKKLPVRGQRTKTNSRTVRGNVRRTMGSGRKPAAEKT